MPSVATAAQWRCCAVSLHERCGPKIASRQAMKRSSALAAPACSPWAYSGAHCRRPVSWARRWCGWGGLRRLTRLNQSGGNLAEASMAFSLATSSVVWPPRGASCQPMQPKRVRCTHCTR